MAVDITLARCFDEHPLPVMSLPYFEQWAVVQPIDDERQQAYCPLLYRLARAEYGAADEVVYAPEHVGILKLEIEKVLGRLSMRKESDTPPGEWGPITSGT